MTLILFSCQTNSPGKLKFENFLKSISHFKNHLNIGETLMPKDFDSLYYNIDLIDTSFLLSYKFIDTMYKTEKYNKFKSLKDYQCSFIGQYKKGNTKLFLTFSNRINADDGYPILTATTISEKGEILDLLRIEKEIIRDPFYQPTQYLTISKDLLITCTLVEKRFKEGDEKLIMTDSTALTKKYSIDKSGHFKLEN